jgi:hypothetical protein
VTLPEVVIERGAVQAVAASRPRAATRATEEVGEIAIS